MGGASLSLWRSRTTSALPVLLLAASIFAGCAAAPPVPGDPFAGFPARLRVLARESQRKGELQKAILLWNAVKGFEPDDPEASGAVSTLQAKARRQAEAHFRKGVELRGTGQFEAAQREFLLALTDDPGLEEAHLRLKETAAPPDVVVYQTREGDTPRIVAEKVYGDPQKAIVVSHFAKVPGTGAGTMDGGVRLVLPAPEPMPEANGRRSGNSLSKARDLLRERKYREAARKAEQILAADPGNRYAGEVLDAAYYRLGKTLLQEGNVRESLRYLEKVDPGYGDAGHVIAVLQGRIEEADSHYAKGLRHFLAEELDAAEREWEESLALDPRHPKARRDLEKVRRMKGALKRMQ